MVNIPFFQPKHIKLEYPDVTQGDESAKTEIEKNKQQIDEMKQKFLHDTGVSGGRRIGAPTFFGLWSLKLVLSIQKYHS